MKKLFALIGLLGLIVGMGGALNAQEASGDTQSKLDTIFLYSYFQNPGEAQTFKFKFSATSGEKFIIKWKGSYHSSATDIDTISVETEKEIEVAYTFTSDYTYSHPTFNVSLTALTPDGHFKSLRIDSTYKYSGLTFKNCILLDTIQVAHNTLNDYNLSIWNCPLLRFLDISHNKLRGWYQEMTSALTYLDCSHNDILDIVEKGFTSLETLDCSYNHRLRQLRLSDCKALVKLTAIHNDSIHYYAFDLPQNSPLQSLTLGYTHQIQTLDLSQCPNLITLNCYGNSQLAELNLSNNPKLETFNCFNCEQLTYLYINHTSWDSLDVSSFSALETLDCSYNRLSYINLNGLENLTQLFCHHNKLSYICLSDCQNLINVDCRNNRFTTIDVPKDMILNDLSCDSNRIPLSVLADLSRHAETDWYEIRQFPTIAPIQVGDLVDLSGETHLGDYWQYEQYTLFFNGQQIEERFNDGLSDDYGLFTFDKAGNYRLHLKCLLNDGNYAIMSAYYDLTVVDSVVRPQFSIPSGAVLPDTALTLSTPTPDARIYYTADGSEPDETALAYAAPIRITEAVTIKAIAIQDTFKSHVATATYTIDTDGARPAFSIPSGMVKRGTTVSLSTTTPNVRIIYTTDGSAPDNNALEYTEPIRINEAMTVKAIAIYKTVKSQVATANYTVDSVANENDLKVSKLRVYAKGQTIYLSETVGEVEVFTVDGHCVYRGFDTVIPVGKRGLYIVSAAGRGWKVSVR